MVRLWAVSGGSENKNGLPNEYRLIASIISGCKYDFISLNQGKVLSFEWLSSRLFGELDFKSDAGYENFLKKFHGGVGVNENAVVIEVNQQIKTVTETMKKLLIASFAVLIAFTSCRKDAGPMVEQNRHHGDFERIKSDGSFELYIEEGEDYEVMIIAPEEIMHKIETEVRGGELRIWMRNHRYKNSRRNEVHITMPYFEGIDIDGSGFAKFLSDFEADNAYVDIDGSGDVNLRGNYKTLEVDIRGSGFIDLSGTGEYLDAQIQGSGSVYGFNYPVKRTDANIEGSGNIETDCSDHLNAEINGSGSVIYEGTPTLDVDINGSGSVRQR